MTKTFATHDGIFHADDVFAWGVLRTIYTTKTETPAVVRTRDRAALAAADIIFDVGDVADPLRGRFDHHQREGRPPARENGIPFSSFGLVWREYGLAYVARLLDPHTPGSVCERIAHRLDEQIVQPVDAADCGIELVRGGEAAFPGITAVSLSAAISGFNPARPPGGKITPEAFAAAFEEATEFAIGCLDRMAIYIHASDAGETAVRAAVSRAVAEGSPVVELAEGGAWQRVVCEAPGMIYVVYPSETGTWMVQCVPPVAGSFEKRKALPAAWGGLRDTKLAAESGVIDAVFCHAGLFICGAQSREGALKLAALAASA